MTVAESEQMIHELLCIGVKGYLLKSDAVADLVVAVEALHRDRSFFNAEIERMVMQGFLNSKSLARDTLGPCALTSREREILQLLADGKTTKEVALMLNLSTKTAETHRANIMRKLNLHSIGELVLYAVRNNILHVTGAPPASFDSPSRSAGR